MMAVGLKRCWIVRVAGSGEKKWLLPWSENEQLGDLVPKTLGIGRRVDCKRRQTSEGQQSERTKPRGTIAHLEVAR
jgi:hypothetical protein